MDAGWDLSEYYTGPDDPQIARDMAAARDEGRALRARYEGRVGALDPAALREAIAAMEAHAATIGRYEDYAFLLTCTDLADATAKSLFAHGQAAGAAARADVQFFVAELQAADDARWDALLAADALAPYRDWLARLRRLAAHRLGEAEERLALRKDVNGVLAWRSLYQQVQATMAVEAGDEKLSLQAAGARATSPDREVRRAAYEGIMAAQARHAPVLTEAFNAGMGDVADMAALRGYADPLAAQLTEEGLAPAVIEALLGAVEARYGLLHRYYATKRKVLGLADFAVYDLPAPYPGTTPEVPWEQARDWVLAAFDGFSPRFGADARGFFDEQRLDLFPRPRKRDSGFCVWSRNDVPPYILMNYEGSTRDVATLAHELGHGVHYCAINAAGHSQFNVRASVFAETPSTFAELLVVRHLAQASPDPALKLELLRRTIEAALGTIATQVQIARWEQAVYARRGQGALSAEALCDLWLAGREALHGPGIRQPAGAEWGWLRVSHAIELPLYTYRYAFGMLAAFAMIRRHAAEGPAFAERYMAMLAAGVSLPADAIVAQVGLDVADPGFWDAGLDHLEALIAEAEAAAWSGS